MTTPSQSFAAVEPSDAERTQLTPLAQQAWEDAVLVDPDVEAYVVQLVRRRSTGETFVAEVRGQSSATGHGRQGLRPQRAEVLRELDERHDLPVWFAFLEGAESRREAWLHDLPAAEAVTYGLAGDPTTRRFGWRVAAMDKVIGRLRVPGRVPPRRSRAQESLGSSRSFA